jgi:hypothetical protein
LNVLCCIARYCELVAVDAAPGVIAAYLLAMVAGFGRIGILILSTKLSRLFEIQSVLTLVQRPQAIVTVERNGGDFMRYLRALVLNEVLRQLWSVLLPLTMPVMNRSFKPGIGTTSHRLIHWAPIDLDDGVFAPFRDNVVVPPLNTEYVLTLETNYVRLHDGTSRHLLQEQES